MAFMEWSDHYSVQVPQIDEQHEQLFVLVNVLYDSIVEGAEQNSLGDILDKLISYTVYHFETEEALFKTYDYPLYEEHKHEHDELTRQVLDLQEQFNNKVVTITYEVMDFVSNWLKEHTTGSDLKFATFMKKHQ